MDSLLVRDGISDMIIGNLKYDNRMNTEIARAVSYNGYYKFVNEKFKFLSASDCYWANSEYDSENGFAIKKIDESHSKIYGELKSSTCNVIPVILVSKEKL